jgi:hypothetical protein
LEIDISNSATLRLKRECQPEVSVFEVLKAADARINIFRASVAKRFGEASLQPDITCQPWNCLEKTGVALSL